MGMAGGPGGAAHRPGLRHSFRGHGAAGTGQDCGAAICVSADRGAGGLVRVWQNAGHRAACRCDAYGAGAVDDQKAQTGGGGDCVMPLPLPARQCKNSLTLGIFLACSPCGVCVSSYKFSSNWFGALEWTVVKLPILLVFALLSFEGNFAGGIGRSAGRVEIPHSGQEQSFTSDWFGATI